MVTLLRRFAAVVFGLGGLVFLLIGGVQLTDQTWESAAGTVHTCTVQTSRSGAQSRTRTEYTCEVTWDAGGTTRSHRLVLPRSLAVPGCPVDLRVKGDTAALATPIWRAAIPAVIGLAMIVMAVVLFRRARRKGSVRLSAAIG